MEIPRKLRRGLADLSPLFGKGFAGQGIPRSPQEHGGNRADPARDDFAALDSPPSHSENQIKCVGIFDPLTRRPFSIAMHLASLLRSSYPKSVLIEPQKICLDEEPMRGVTVTKGDCHLHGEPDRNPRKAGCSDFLFLVDLSGDTGCFRRVAALRWLDMIDAGIVIAGPTLESLTEAYRWMKAASALNPYLDFFFLCDGSPGDPRAGGLFEPFSEMVTLRLGVQLYWLGFVDQPCWDPLFLAGGRIDNLLEKRQLADWFYGNHAPGLQAQS